VRRRSFAHEGGVGEVGNGGTKLMLTERVSTKEDFDETGVGGGAGGYL
jgi:hypothetical protein